MWDKGIVYDVTNTTVAELIEFLDEKEYSAHECVLNIGDRGTSVLLTVGAGKKRFVVGQELMFQGEKWRVVYVMEATKTLHLVRAASLDRGQKVVSFSDVEEELNV